MAIPTTYNTLVSAVQEELEDNGTEFVSYIPTAIRLGELRINKDLDGIYSTEVTTVGSSVGEPIAQKPEGYRLGYDLNVIVSGQRRTVTKTTKDFLIDYWPNQTSTGVPKYYADHSVSTIMLAPTPDANYPVVFTYSKYPTFINNSNQTNVIIDKYSDLLFYATLCEQTRFARMPEAEARFEQIYQQRLSLTREETRRERADNSYPTYTTYVTQNRMDKKA